MFGTPTTDPKLLETLRAAPWKLLPEDVRFPPEDHAGPSPGPNQMLLADVHEKQWTQQDGGGVKGHGNPTPEMTKRLLGSLSAEFKWRSGGCGRGFVVPKSPTNRCGFTREALRGFNTFSHASRVQKRVCAFGDKKEMWSRIIVFDTKSEDQRRDEGRNTTYIYIQYISTHSI